MQNPPSACWRGLAANVGNKLFPVRLARHGMMWPAAFLPERLLTEPAGVDVSVFSTRYGV